jgi:hypothetical protein
VSPTCYVYDVFLSYSHAQKWPEWVEAHFLPIIEHWLSAELGRDVVIFRDRRNVEAGQQWAQEIEGALASSRTMISLWSKSYFQSEWCRHELGAILARADQLRSFGHSGEIVFPVAIHDSDPADLPEPARALQRTKIQRFADPFAHPKGQLRESLSQTLQGMCRQAARQIGELPDHTFAWPMADYSAYAEQLKVKSPGQITKPSLGGAP